MIQRSCKLERIHAIVWNISLKELIPFLHSWYSVIVLNVWNISLKELILITALIYGSSETSLKYILKGIDTWLSICVRFLWFLVWNISLKELIHDLHYDFITGILSLKYILKGIDTLFPPPGLYLHIFVWNISLKELIHAKEIHCQACRFKFEIYP